MYKSLAEICEVEKREGLPFWKIVQQSDCVETGMSETEAFEKMRVMYQAMKEADDRYEGDLKSSSGLVGGEGKKMQEAREAGLTVCGRMMGKVMEKALKTGESNACMKRIVAAPTAGSCEDDEGVRRVGRNHQSNVFKLARVGFGGEENICINPWQKFVK